MSKQNLLDFIDSYESEFTEMAKKIWEHPQVAYEETYACDLQINRLEKEGFRIQSSIAGISTAFVAEYGAGKPIIGILGEYDALPGLSQKVGVAHEPIVSHGAGNGVDCI